MSKKTYLLFYTDGNVEKTKKLDDEIYENVYSGFIKVVVDTKAWKYLDDNSEWEDIPTREEPDEEEDESLCEDDEL